ncbi:hypothetical protein TIFTF001_034815 [Ficus carica]|nr:hypothetical protein TIFTF001_034794 [Ficus carica]GMN65747.1 hypothetical protein TIFTF001_034815 [Ficus carica]
MLPPPSLLSHSPAGLTTALLYLSFSRQCRRHPLLPIRPSPSPLSPFSTAAALSSQQGHDSLAYEKSKIELE